MIGGYSKLNRAVEMLNSGDFNGLIVSSQTGLGKSWRLDKKLKDLGCQHTIYKGDISEAKMFEFLQQNAEGKIIVFRDMGKLLRNISFIDMMKNAMEKSDVRELSRKSYAEHEGVEEIFEFKSKIIIELNEIGSKYQADLDALMSRGLHVELNFSKKEIENIMRSISSRRIENKVTEYLIRNSQVLGRSEFNLRTQERCITIAKAAIRDNLEWDQQVRSFINDNASEPKKLLYQIAGRNKIKRINFVKHLMIQKGYSVATAQRRIRDWLEIGEIYSDSKMKQANLSINKILSNV